MKSSSKTPMLKHIWVSVWISAVLCFIKRLDKGGINTKNLFGLHSHLQNFFSMFCACVRGV